jgi:hypothetical protein
MKALGAVLDDAAARAEAKRKRHRVWHWCRHKNGFCDQPLWRVVAERLNLPVYQVVAFASRLEEHANAATSRGYVGDVSPAVFGAALGMSTEDAARIFAELAVHEIGWIDQEFVATFYERNKDDETEDATAALRARRSYARRGLRGALKRLVADELIGEADADAVIADLAHMGDDELFELDRRRKNGQLAGFLLSTPHATSRREDESSRVRNVRPHTRADAPESKHTLADSVDNSGDTVRGEAAGSARADAAPAVDSAPATAEEWLRTEGQRIVTERMRLYPGVTATKIQRWQREVGGDAEAVAQMIDAARQISGDAFELAVQRQIDQRKLDALGPRLPLMRQLDSKRGGGAA